MEIIRNEIAETFERLLADECASDRIRLIEAGQDHQPLWNAIEASGFVDALVPDGVGGVGLSFHDAAPIIELTGAHAVPLPLAETIVLRGLLQRSGCTVPDGSIAFGGSANLDCGTILCRGVVEGVRANYLLVCADDVWRLVATALATVETSGLESTLRLPLAALDQSAVVTPITDPSLAEALVRSLQIAGAAKAVLNRTLDFANCREQFGRPIGKFQAIQHQLSLMAEHVYSARMAASLASCAVDFAIDPLRTAVAKARTGEAAAEVAALSHSIHGAIGFTQEYDLQFLTRRLHIWRRSAGADAHWQQRVGRTLLASNTRALDLLMSVTD